MNMQESHIAPIDKDIFRRKMLQWKQSELSIRAFEQKLRQLEKGGTGLIPEKDIQPVTDLSGLAGLDPEYREAGSKLLKKTVMIKLNGGLGTGMGMSKAKSLLPAKQGLSFLDIIIKHAGAQGSALILMNSARTRDDSLAIMRKYPHVREQEKSLPLDFEQSMNPKIEISTMQPVKYPENRDMEWCPPGHGDLFTAIQAEGVLSKLLDSDCEYAFISNADNLCASLHPGILGYMAIQGIPFLMEVTRRTSGDRKGGHLARSSRGGSLLLRESAQCPEDDENSFQDIRKHRFFNTNNLWVNLEALRDILNRHDGVIPLPLIRNKKHVNPVDDYSPPVYQLESAMGAAINFFQGAAAMEVPRSRFLPVKSNEDLLVVRSDRIVLLHDDYTLTQCRSCRYPEISVKLDSRYYKNIEPWKKAFPGRIPSLKDCSEFCVSGPFLFRDNIVATGRVALVNRGTSRVEIPEGTELNGFYLES
jgi:UTP--glucose-1-phosphate uridylyltransferase